MRQESGISHLAAVRRTARFCEPPLNERTPEKRSTTSAAQIECSEYDAQAPLWDPSNPAFGREVVWSHPAFANRSVYARNDKEIICVSLAAPQAGRVRNVGGGARLLT